MTRLASCSPIDSLSVGIVFRAALALLSVGCTIDATPMLRPLDGGLDASIDASLDAPRGDAGFSCTPGELGCWGQTHYVCGTDDTRLDEEVCADACSAALGCVRCIPGTRACEGDRSMICNEAGDGFRLGRDCGDWEVSCGGDGFCADDCAAVEGTRSYIGCEYWPVPLANDRSLRGGPFDFRVVVTNPNRATAEVTITRGGRFEARETVPPGALVEIVLPFIDAVSFPFDGETWESQVVPDGAYRLIASRPVIVAQFNPFHYSIGGQDSFTNDASLLLPVHALGNEYVGLSYVPLSGMGSVPFRIPGYLALVGVSEAATAIEITLTADAAADASGRWAATPAGGTLSFTLARGEVAEITPAMPPPCDATRPGFHATDAGDFCFEEAFDLTGSRIRSDGPLSVFGGHTCAYAPYDTPACDHLETTLAPVGTWGTRFETMPMRDPSTTVPNIVRIVAAHDGTMITATPPLVGLAPGLVLDRGEHVDAQLVAPTSILGSHPIQVGQILLGQNLTDPPLTRGDPGLTTLVPREQFRSDYVFVTPSSYTPVVNGQSWLLVSRAPGVSITLDGALVEATWSVSGERELALVPVDGGAHHATSDQSFGLIAFGLGRYTSYAYPAGLDLRAVPF